MGYILIVFWGIQMAKKPNAFLDEVNRQNSETNNKNAFIQQRYEQKKLAEELDLMRRKEKLAARGAKYAKLDESAKPEWAEIEELGKVFYNDAQKGYDNWRSAMSQLINFDMKVAKFVSKKIVPYYVTNPACDLVSDAYDGLKDMTEEKLGKNKLAGIEFSVGFNDDNELIIDNLVSADGVDLTYEESLAFQASIFYLLEAEGYQHDPLQPRKFFIEEGGVRRHLTPADEPDIGHGVGLGRFLEDKLQAMVTEAHRLNSVKNTPRP